jgi:plasmid replication initiation protein
MSKEIVKYNNKMNSIPLRNFEKMDLNFFYAICSKVKEKGSDLVEISLDDLKELTDYKSTSAERFREDLMRMNKKLMSCNGMYETEEEIVQFNLFSTFRVLKTKPILKVRVNQDMTWLLNNIAKEFTSFELQEYVALEGIYSKALYRLLKQWKTNGKTPKYSVDELKELLSIPNYETRRFMDKIINPAIEDIKKHKAFENLWCEVVYAKKRGKPVDGYIFHFDKDDLKGQISFKDVEEFEQIAAKTKTEKAAVMATANNLLKAKKSTKKQKNSFVEGCSRRKASTDKREERYNALLEKSLLGMGLTGSERTEFEELSRERG